MNQDIQLRMELTVNGQKFLNYIELYNKDVQAQIKRGIEEGINEMCKDGALVKLAKEETIKSITRSVSSAMYPYEIERILKEKIANELSNKFTAYAKKIVDKITKDLNNE